MPDARVLVATLIALTTLTARADQPAQGKAATPGAAPAREVHCTVHQDGELVLDGPCQFQPDGRNGSFALSARGEGELLPGILMVSVSIVSRGVAEVRGLTTAGINSRWGEAKRSQQDGACWKGEDFQICAR